MGVGLILYTAGIASSLLHLAPQARDLVHKGSGLFMASTSMQQLDSALGATARELTTLAREHQRSGQPLDAAVTERVLVGLRQLTDSTWSLQASQEVGDIPVEARVAIARALTAESEAVAALVQAEVKLELGEADGAEGLIGEAELARRTARQQLETLEGLLLSDVVARERNVARATSSMLRSALVWAAIGVLLLALVGRVMYHRLYRPLGQLDAGLNRIASGDFEVAIPVEREDEMGRLQAHLNDVSVVLRERAEGDRRQVHNLAERLGRVLDESSNEVYIFDAASWRFLLVNRGARRNLGYAEGDLAELTPLDLLPEFDERRWAALLRTLQEGSQKRVLLSTVQLRADGSTYPVEMSLQLSHAEDPPVFHAVVQDVSERARIEAERDRVFDLSADLLATGSYDGRLTRVNPVWERTLGFKEEEFLERPFFDFVHPDDRGLARRQLEGLRTGTPIRGTAVRLQCRDGSYRWVSWNIDPPQDGVLYAAGRDITERRRAEQRQAELQAAVARAAREWTMTFDALDDPVVIVNRRNEIVRVNEAARRLTGLAHRDVAGKRLDTLAPEQLWRRGSELVRRATSTGRTASSQVRSKPDGRTWDIEVNPILGAATGRGTAIVTAHDVSPVVRLQDAVRRNEAMAAMGSLVAGVAHEVRNPLFSMSATLDAFEARHGKDHPDQRHVQVLRSQLERLQQLMRELLEYGKPPQLHLEPVRFEMIVDQAFEESAHLISESGIVVERAFENEMPAVRGDRARLVQVYVNLITNAIHHSSAGGSVRVGAHALRQNGTVWLETTVEDTGSGFNPDDLDRVFEPFFTRRRGGTGLGLALVQRIVEQHGGAVTAENRPEGGATVRVRLPVAGS